jgi:dextranase
VLQRRHGNRPLADRRFYITDLRPGAPGASASCRVRGGVDEVGFDGIHMDQYGFPKWSYDAAGAAVDLATRSRASSTRPRTRGATREGAAVLFNAVNDWPIEEVAPSDQAAVYIEVWPPHDRYRDLVDLIRRARDLSGKQAILAAYLEAVPRGGPAPSVRRS